MPQVDISEALYARLAAFEPLLETVIEDEVSIDACAEMALERALDVMLSDIIGSADPQLLLASIQQLAARHPEIVYGFMADTMKAGAATERESARVRIGFVP